MAAVPQSRFIQLPAVFLLYSLLIFTSTTASSAPSLPPTADYNMNNNELTKLQSTLLASILSTLGFQELSSVAVAANISNNTPFTIFAPTDSSLLTCSSCSVPLLLKEHTVPGLYPLRFLRNLAFGTKIETLADDYCLTITTSNQGEDSKAIFVNGVQITSPDLFNNGIISIHGIQGFVSHLSPLSCNVERMTTLSFLQPTSPDKLPLSAPVSMMRLLLNDAVIRLRHSGYNLLALALKMRLQEFSDLKAMSLFALEDAVVFSDSDVGCPYLSNLLFHVVPNRRLMTAELVSLPMYTVLPTMQVGQNLVVTTSAAGVSSAPLNINFVRITTLELLHNSRIVVHAVSTPFPHMHQDFTAPKELHSYSEGMMEQPEACDPEWSGGVCEIEAASVPVGSIGIGDEDDRHCL